MGVSAGCREDRWSDREEEGIKEVLDKSCPFLNTGAKVGNEDEHGVGVGEWRPNLSEVAGGGRGEEGGNNIGWMEPQGVRGTQLS